jgi:hypothetical protein
MTTSEDRTTRPWWRSDDPDLDRAVAVVAEQVVDAARGRSRGARTARGQDGAGGNRSVDVRSVVAEVCCAHPRCQGDLDPVEVVGDLRLDTDEEALRGLVAHLVAAGIARACRVHVRLGPRSIVVVDGPSAAAPGPGPIAPDVGDPPAGTSGDETALTWFADRLHAAIDVDRGAGGVQTAVTLPAESLVRAG